MDLSLASTTSKSDSELTFNSSTSGTGNNNVRMLEDMFEKVLSPRDVDERFDRLVIPEKYAEWYFPLESSNKFLSFQERNGKMWRFYYLFWNPTKSYVITDGWSRFVKEKNLQAGDTISFQREIGDKSETSRLYIDWRHRSDMKPEYSSVPVREHSGGEAFSGEIGSGSTIVTVAGTSNPNLEFNAFKSFLNSRGLTLSGCKGTDIIDFLCVQKNMGDSNALVCRLSAACERRGIKPKDNPFRSLAVIRYLQLMRRVSGKTECIVFTCDGVHEDILTKQILAALQNKNVTSFTCNLSQENLDVEMFYRSSVGIMVLSYSFARSSHSLDNLVTIMERWKAKDIIVIPVYYKIKLSDIVQLQYQNYFQADKVPKWKSAIAELASIKGP